MASVTPQTSLCKIFYVTFLNVFLTLYFDSSSTSSQATIINTLPGFNATLPFVLETGYINVGKANDVELFYYFIESEKDPQHDPLLLWLIGGPGCSGLNGFIEDSGPLLLDYTSTCEDLPSLDLNPYSWTKFASIIYIDQPVGTGFSYASSSEGYYSSNTKSATDVYDFLRKWLLNHPNFVRNSLYIGGESYGGMFAPMVTLEIEKGNEAGYLPYMSLQGYVLGNPFTNMHDDENSRVQYAHRMALISDEIYKSAESSCNGEYVNLNPKNSVCMFYLQLINECIAKLNSVDILGVCKLNTKANYLKWAKRRLLQEGASVDASFPFHIEASFCSDNGFTNKWANDQRVQQAIHIREGTKVDWIRCNHSISFEQNVQNVVEYHRNFSRRDYRALVYSGDHDLTVPYISTLSWIKSLNLTIEDEWKPWFVDGQTAGYTQKYKKNEYDLTFATVKGAGHIAAEYKPKEMHAMLERWFSMSQL